MISRLSVLGCGVGVELGPWSLRHRWTAGGLRVAPAVVPGCVHTICCARRRSPISFYPDQREGPGSGSSARTGSTVVARGRRRAPRARARPSSSSAGSTRSRGLRQRHSVLRAATCSAVARRRPARVRQGRRTKVVVRFTSPISRQARYDKLGYRCPPSTTRRRRCEHVRGARRRITTAGDWGPRFVSAPGRAWVDRGPRRRPSTLT